MTDEEQAKSFGRLEALIESSSKANAERFDRSERVATERYNQLEARVRVVDARSQHTAEELSDHIKKDDMVHAAIARHMGNIEQTIQRVESTTTALSSATKQQDGELGTQTVILREIQRKNPTFTSICTGVGATVGAAVAAYLAAGGHIPH